MKHDLTIYIASAAPTAWNESLQELLALSLMQLQPSLTFQIQFVQQPLSKLEPNEALIAVISREVVERPDVLAQASQLPSDRVFKCVKFPMDPQLLPESLRTLLAYNFYEIDALAGTIASPAKLSANMPVEFWTDLVDLAYDLLEVVQGPRMMNIGKGRCIYLAETGFDLDHNRRTIRRELSRFGYKVLPNHLLPQAEEMLRPSIHEDLAQCVFSIHLVSEGRSELLAGQDTSIAEFQYELAAFYAHQQAKLGKNFRILIWLPPFLKFTNERQQFFAEKLIEKADSQKGIELIQMQLEDFKTIVLRQLAFQLRDSLTGSADDAPIKTDKPSVYLMADLRDLESSKSMADWLPLQGYELFWAGTDSKATERGKHIVYLNQADANIVFFEKATKEWLVTKLQDILKAPGLGRRKPKAPTIVWVSNPQAEKFVRELTERLPQYRDVLVLSSEKHSNWSNAILPLLPKAVLV